MSESDQEAIYRTLSEASSALRLHCKTGKAIFTRGSGKNTNHIKEEVIGNDWSIELIYLTSEIDQKQRVIITYTTTNQYGRNEMPLFCGEIVLLDGELKGILDVFRGATFVEAK